MIRLLLFGVLYLFCSCSVALAQVSAAFTANVTSGCGPLVVQFSDQSTGAPTAWSWSLGNGNNSTDQHPQAIYSAPGTYTVSLTASNSGSTDAVTQTAFITVFANPQANFAASTAQNGCVPLNVQFQDLSVAGSAPIVSWLWDFGDGNTNTGQNPNNSFGQAGQFNVSLQLVDANGCAKTLQLLNYVSVSNNPTVQFTANPVYSCTVPQTVTFTNTSFGDSPLTYLWSFGDMTSSTVDNPVHTYNSLGSYGVHLLATDNNGCSRTLDLDSLITLEDVVPQFVTGPNPVCLGYPMSFTNTSNTTANSEWDFGDGTTGTGPVINHVFPAAGTYNVQLVVGPDALCKDSIINTISVEEPMANFSTNPHAVCDVADTVHFTDLTPNAASWEWTIRLHGGISATPPPLIFGLPNPDWIVSQNALEDVFPAPLQGVFSTRLIVTTAAGCIDSLTIDSNIFVTITTASFLQDTASGCAPVSIQFSDQSFPADSLISWEWSVDSLPWVASGTNPSMVLDSIGRFFVKLIVTSVGGCIDSTTESIEAGLQPTANFTHSTVTCASGGGNFFTSLSQPPINGWWWILSSSGGYIDSNLTNIQFLDTGQQTVKLIASHFGCLDTLESDSGIYVLGPVCDFSPVYDCANPFDIGFSGIFIDADSWIWYYGDGAVDTTNAINVSHTYQLGADTAYLVSHNDSTGCNFASYVPITAVQVGGNFAITDTSFCPPALLDFDAGSSLFTMTYQWNFGDSTEFESGLDTVVVDSLIYHYFTESGFYPVRLITNAPNGCKDTTIITVHGHDVIADFVLDTTSGCAPLTLTYTDATIADTTIVAWEWYMSNQPAAFTETVVRTYYQSNVVNVYFIAEDAIGCRDTILKTDLANIITPTASFSLLDSAICVNDTAVFVVDPAPGTTYYWTFGDGATDSVGTTHAYVTPGLFDVSLTVIDSNNCQATVSDSGLISVQTYPQAFFTADTIMSDCFPLLVMLSDTSGNPNITAWNWNFGDNASGSILSSPAHNYTSPNDFDVTLVVSTSNGCKDTLVKPAYIQIASPFANFRLLSDSNCAGDPVLFTVDSVQSAAFFLWDFGDGDIQQGDTISHTYEQGGQAAVTLLFQDSTASCSFSHTDTIYVDLVEAQILLTDTAGCTPFVLLPVDQSLNATLWNWNFGSGQSTVQNPEIEYLMPGTHQLKLWVSDSATGCVDSLKQTIIVWQRPAVDALPDTQICEGNTMQLIGSGEGIPGWSPGADLSDSTIFSPVYLVSTNQFMVLTMTDANGCTNSDSVFINAIPLPNLTILEQGDTMLIPIGNDTLLEPQFEGAMTNFFWMPSSTLSCTNCITPVANPLQSTAYTLLIQEQCFADTLHFLVNVDANLALEVPSAFTPNGDGANDRIFVRGFGIDELLEFSIYNRWGQVVFASTDLSNGWDGTYKGQPQNSESYLYTLRAQMLDGTVVAKKGYISLLR